MASTRHLRQSLDHRIVRGLQEHDISHVTLDDFIYRIAIHVSSLLQRLKNQRKLLLLAQTNRQHGFKPGDTVALRLEVTQLVKHEARLVQRLLARLGHIRLIKVQVHKLLDKDQHELRVLHQVRWCHEEHSLGLFRVPHRRQDDGRHALSHRLRLSSLIE